MGSQPSPPSPQDIANQSEQLANTQQNLNVQSQAGSLPNQSNWLGGMQFNQTGTGPGGTPIYTATSSLSPAQQGLYNEFLGTQQLAGSQAANALGFGNYGTISPEQQIGNMTSGETGQLMGTWLSAQEPFFQTQSTQLDTQLRNQGLQPGDPAYDVAMRQLDTNMGYAVAGAASQFEPQAFNQATTLYGLPMNVGQQLAQWGAPISPSTAYGPNVPQLQPANVVSADQAVGQQAMDAYQAQQSQYNAMLGGMGQLGAAGIGALGNYAGASAMASALGSAGAAGAPLILMSDIRAKHDVELLGNLENGLGIYRFSYNGSNVRHTGVIAQDVLGVIPEAVTSNKDGYLCVNYTMLGLAP